MAHDKLFGKFNEFILILMGFLLTGIVGTFIAQKYTTDNAELTAANKIFEEYSKLSGDFILTANFELLGEGVDPHRKVGWMIRESLDDDAAHVSATLHGDGLTVLQWRELKGAHMGIRKIRYSPPR